MIGKNIKTYKQKILKKRKNDVNLKKCEFFI